jgi:ABC-2 type transport system permease protein
MTRLVRAEMLKLRTVRTLLWLTLALIVLVVIPVISVAASSSELRDAADDRSVARIAAISVIFALVVGITMIGSEASTGTLTQTLLVVPLRERVLAAKACVAAVVGALLAVIAEALTLVIAVPALGLNVHNARLVLTGVVLAAAVGAATGVGVGALFHRQGTAIVVSLLWLLIGENVFAAAFHDNIKYFPGHVFAAAVSGSAANGQLVGTWAGVGGAAVYAAAFLLVGTTVLARRDV